MKNQMKSALGVLCAAVVIGTCNVDSALAEGNAAAPGEIDFGTFSPPKEGQFVEVNIRENLINMVARLTEETEPDLARILRGLRSIRVNVIGLNESNSDEIRARVHSVRQQLHDAGWDRIVTVQDGKDDVSVFTKLKGDEAVEGVAVTVLSGDSEAVFVNIVGDIRPDQIARVGERLHIDPLKELSRELGGE